MTDRAREAGRVAPIERMVRAMREEDPLPLSMFTDQDLRELAVASLRAIREPSEAQIRAVDAALHEHWPNARKMAVAMHYALIDAALTSQPQEPS